MIHQIAYENGTIAQKIGTTTVLTTETQLIQVTDMKYANKSQMTAYYDYTLGSATAVNIRYYFTPDFGVTWFDLPIKDLTTGNLIDRPSVINTGSPAKVIEDIPVPSCTGIRITGTATGAIATINNCWLLLRDN